jgi:hypothetical protein
VTKKKSKDKHVIQKVMFDGTDILWIDDDDAVGLYSGRSDHRAMSIDKFEKRLADEMVVPSRLLKATYSFDQNSNPSLLFPAGGTTRKR